MESVEGVDSEGGDRSDEVYHPDPSPSDEDQESDDDKVTFLKETSYDPYSPNSKSFMVVRCVLVQQKTKDDWRKTTIFYTYATCGEKSCKIIIDSESCTNVVSAKTVYPVGLSPIPHPQPYKLSRVNASSILVSHRYQVPIAFSSYTNTI